MGKLIKEISEYITGLFEEKLPDWALYHNLSHTLETVKASEQIAEHYNLKNPELEVILIASWFHDCGYIYGPENHEEKSIEILLHYFEHHSYPKNLLNKIISCIRATKLDSFPDNLLEKIICDADLISLGKKDYFKTNNLLKQEFERRQNIVIEEIDWLKRSEKFLSSHKYYTYVANRLFNDQVEINRKELKRMISRMI